MNKIEDNLEKNIKKINIHFEEKLCFFISYISFYNDNNQKLNSFILINLGIVFRY